MQCGAKQGRINKAAQSDTTQSEAAQRDAEQSRAKQCKAVQKSAARQARRSCRRVVQLGAATERTATAEKSPLVDDAQAGSAAGNKAMSRHNRPAKAVTGHREMRPIHLDGPRARLPVNSWSHEAPAPRLRPQWIHAPYTAARARSLAARKERGLGARSNPQSRDFLDEVFGLHRSRKRSISKRIFG